MHDGTSEKRPRSDDIERPTIIVAAMVTDMVTAMVTKRAGMSYFAVLTLCFWSSFFLGPCSLSLLGPLGPLGAFFQPTCTDTVPEERLETDTSTDR